MVDEDQRLKAIAATAVASVKTMRALAASRMDQRHNQVNVLMD